MQPYRNGFGKIRVAHDNRDGAAADRIAEYDKACRHPPLQRHSSARQARRYDIELQPGEMLYVPVGWWHQVAALDFSVTLTYINFLWPNDGHANYPPNP